MANIIKRTFIILACTLALSGCSNAASKDEVASDFSNITMEALYEANDIGALLSNHNSWAALFSSSDSDETTYIYRDREYLFERFNDESCYIISKEETWQWDYSEDNQTLYYYWYAMDEKEEQEMRMVPSDYILLDKEYFSKETIENVQENEDGTLTLTTMLNSEDTKEYMSTYGLEYPEGHDTVEQKSVYVVDAKTLEIASISMTTVMDGEDGAFSLVEITPGADRPDELTEALVRIDEAKNDEKTETRTARVIYDYGKDEEQSFEMVAGRSYRVVVTTRDGYDYLYTNPEKTEIYDGGDGVSDMTIYAFTEE